MVLGFDNTALLVALAFAAVVLKPSQLRSIGYQTGRTVGWAVGQLSSLQKQIVESGPHSELGRIKAEVQESLSTLDAIQSEIRRGTQMLPSRHRSRQAVKENTKESDQPLPVSAESVGMMKREGKGMRYGSEIMLQAIVEEEVARRAKTFMKTGESP